MIFVPYYIITKSFDNSAGVALFSLAVFQLTSRGQLTNRKFLGMELPK